MKKFLITLAIAFMMAFSANAQIATENAKLTDNVYVTLSGGVATPLDFNKMFPVNPTATLAIGKEFTPVWGAEIEGTAWFGSHANCSHASSMPRFDSYFSHNAVRGSYVGLNGTVNLSNLFDGYIGTPRVFETKLVGGIGWAHMFSPNETNNANNYLGAKTGLDFIFNLGNSKAHSVSIKPAVLWNLSAPGQKNGNMSFNKMGAQLSIGIGYTYHFRTSNGTRHFKTYDVGAMQNEIAYLNSELAKKPKEVIVEKTIPILKEVPVAIVKDACVFFEFDSAELDDRAKTELDKIGQNGVYDIDGFASIEGSNEYNLELSQRRAEAVKKYLEGRGCKINKAIGRGVMFGPSTGRVAIVTPTK